MASGGLNKYIDAAAEIGRNPSEHQIQPEFGETQADTGRDCRTRLARPNFQARTVTEENSCFPVQLTTSRTGNLTRLPVGPYSFYIDDDHTYIHT